MQVHYDRDAKHMQICVNVLEKKENIPLKL